MSQSLSRVFLSHATPEDNEFTRWLAAKLASVGYDVWCDFDELRGGDIFWDKIEATMRNEAARLIAVVSSKSYKKDGVKKEWALAATIEKTRPGFVIPVRLGDFDFSELPILLHQKNVIDFGVDWFAGLRQVLDALEHATVPKSDTNSAATALSILRQGQKLDNDFSDQIEQLDSNWLEIQSLPEAIEVNQILDKQRQIPLTDRNRALPWFEINDRIVGFARRSDMAELFRGQLTLRAAEACLTEDFLAGRVDLVTRVRPRDAQARVNFLLRQAWDLLAQRKGLSQYKLANDTLAWYVPLDMLPKQKAAFIDADSKQRRRQLAGTSQVNKVNWHYGVSVFPVLSSPRHFELHGHIVFSNLDGSLVDVQRMHRLRRSFCRNWWNDRWRGFLRAYLALLSNGEATISLPVGSERAITVVATPSRFVSTVGLLDYTNITDDEIVELVASEPEFADDEDQDADENEGAA